MNKIITLSYVVTTHNKFPYLTEVLEQLFKNIKEDEEIVIIDGASTDGTVEYLTELYKEDIIQQFISEPDKGEAHGFNKGFLLANGKLIKVITDDDAFNYHAIHKCKEFMLEHPEIDVMGGNTGNMEIANKASLSWNEDIFKDFLNWKEGKLKRFFFNGTCLMLRRSSLPLIGLVDSNILLADFEYTLRMTGIVNLAWCSGIISVRILNPNSNNLVFIERAKEEFNRICLYYNYNYPNERKIEELKKKSVYKKTRSLAAKIIKLIHKSGKKSPSVIEPFSSFEEAHTYSLNWINHHPQNKIIQFYKR